MHDIRVIATDLFGVDSGRRRYRVECHTCQVVVHEATTGPVIRVKEHLEGVKGYERPMKPGEAARGDLLRLITGPEGYEVDLFAMLCLRPLEDGRFAVSYEPPDAEEEETVYETAGEAVDAFLALRDKLKLGYDYEGGS